MKGRHFRGNGHAAQSKPAGVRNTVNTVYHLFYFPSYNEQLTLVEQRVTPLQRNILMGSVTLYLAVQQPDFCRVNSDWSRVMILMNQPPVVNKADRVSMCVQNTYGSWSYFSKWQNQQGRKKIDN